MGSRCCVCSLTPILAVAGLLGLGAAGYRVAAGGCPMCNHDQAASTTLVSTSGSAEIGQCPAMGHDQAGHTKLVGADGQPACCAGMTQAECEAKMAQCPAHSGCCNQQNEAKKAVSPEKIAAAGK